MEVELKGKDLLISISQQDAELRKLRGAAFLQPVCNADIDSDLRQALRAGPDGSSHLLGLAEGITLSCFSAS
jgi:hypothetical protein